MQVKRSGLIYNANSKRGKARPGKPSMSFVLKPRVYNDRIAKSTNILHKSNYMWERLRCQHNPNRNTHTHTYIHTN